MPFYPEKHCYALVDGTKVCCTTEPWTSTNLWAFWVSVKVHPIYFLFSCLPVFHVFWSPNFSHPGLFSEPRYFMAFHHSGNSADFLLQFICSSNFTQLC